MHSKCTYIHALGARDVEMKFTKISAMDQWAAQEALRAFEDALPLATAARHAQCVRALGRPAEVLHTALARNESFHAVRRRLLLMLAVL